MTVEFVLAALPILSGVNAFFTQCAKKLFDDMGWKYKSNTLAGVVSIIVSGFVCYAHAMFTHAVVDELLVISYIGFVAASWGGAMVGYDKAIQTIKQYKEVKDNGYKH